MNTMSPKDRLTEVVKNQLHISIREFEQEIGVSNAAIHHIPSELSKNIREKISARYPQIDMRYIMEGIHAEDSNVIVGDGNTQGIDPKNFDHDARWFEMMERKDEQIAIMQKQISSLIDKIGTYMCK